MNTFGPGHLGSSLSDISVGFSPEITIQKLAWSFYLRLWKVRSKFIFTECLGFFSEKRSVFKSSDEFGILQVYELMVDRF